MRNREEKKKCKGQETTIGKIIYGFLLFLPLLAIGVTCGYAMFNKNAYQSFEGEFSNSIPNYTDTTLSVTASNNGNYRFVAQTLNLPQQTNTITLNFNNVISNYNSSNANIEGTSVLGINFNSIQNTNLENYTNNSKSLVFTTYKYYYNGTGTSKIKFCFLDNEINSNVTLPQNLTWFEKDNAFITFERTDDINIYASHLGYYYISNVSTGLKDIIYYTIKVTTDLSNVFYYSIDKVQQSPLFNWAENSIIYTTTATTCNALSITTPFIPLLMSYWLIISVIYFLYDIALMLIWIIHKKIHELQESI